MVAGVVVTFLPVPAGHAADGLKAVAWLAQSAASTLTRWLAGRYGDRHGTAAGLLVPAVLGAAAGVLALVLIANPVVVVTGMAVFGANLRVAPERRPGADGPASAPTLPRTAASAPCGTPPTTPGGAFTRCRLRLRGRAGGLPGRVRPYRLHPAPCAHAGIAGTAESRGPRRDGRKRLPERLTTSCSMLDSQVGAIPNPESSLAGGGQSWTTANSCQVPSIPFRA
jgi:hypothetical protein